MKLFDSKTPWVFFVLCAMGFTALSPFYGHQESGSVVFASLGDDSSPDDQSKIVLAGTPEAQDTANPPPLSELSLQPKAGDLSCNCNMHGEHFNQLNYETADVCGPDRNYLADGLAQFKTLDKNGYYTQTRDDDRDNSRIPRKCFLFAMKHTLPPSFKKSAVFGTCPKQTKKVETKDEKAAREAAEAAETPDDKKSRLAAEAKAATEDFDRTTFKPCISEDLVNVVYNSYLDATDCFQVPPKFAVAKFMNESGVIPNIVAANNDAGLSQFSTGALEILQETYKQWSPQILTSGRTACKKLLTIKGAMPMSPDQITAKDTLKCEVISVPPNPVRNFIFYGAYYHIVKDDVARLFNRAVNGTKVSGADDPSVKTTDEMLKDAKIDTFNKDKILDILQVMAYNTGPKAVIYFREWLDYRTTKFHTTPITKADLDMQLKPDPWSLIPDKTTDEQLAAKYDQKGKRAMSFPEWLIVVRGRFRYASFVRFYGDRLDAQLGDAVCTPKNFMRMDE